MTKNYYTILGVSPDATPEEIRAAYRRLAKEYHPDKGGGSSDDFLELQEAYSVLSNPEQRRAYDHHLQEIKRRSAVSVCRNRRVWTRQLGPESFSVSSRWAEEETGAHWNPEIETPAPAWSPTLQTSARRAEESLSPFSVEIPLSAHQAWTGGCARIRMPVEVVCPNCRGVPHMGPFVCPRCSGTGSVVREIPVSVSFPPRMNTDYAVLVPVDHVGSEDRYLSVLFRIVEFPDF